MSPGSRPNPAFCSKGHSRPTRLRAPPRVMRMSEMGDFMRNWTTPRGGAFPPRRVSASREGAHALRGAKYQYIGGTQCEDAVGDDARDVVELGLELGGFHDLQIAHVEDEIAVVGGEALTQYGLAAELYEFARDVAARHGDHLDGQWKGAEHVHEFGFVGDADEFLGDRRHDLLARECAAAALDEMEILGGLVGAVHIEGHVVDVVEVEHGYAVLLETLGRGIRACHGTVDLVLNRRQRIEEKVGGGAAADADDGAGLFVLQRRIRRGLFEGVLGHSDSPVVR